MRATLRKKTSLDEMLRKMERRLRAAVYCRVSTDDQADRGTSLDTQERAGRQWAAEHGCDVPDGWAFCDDFTGYVKQRPEMNKLRELVTRGQVDVVIFFDISRLARKWRLQQSLMDEFEGEGVDLQFVRHKKPETLEDWLLLSVEGYTVEKHRDAIVEATERGLRERVRRGGLRVGRYPSYGLRYLEPDEGHPKWTYALDEREGGEAMAVMRRLYDGLIAGKTECRLAQELNREHVRTPAQYHWDMGHRSKRSPARPDTRWSRGTIYSLVKNPVYKGERRSFAHRQEKYLSEQRDPLVGERLEKRHIRHNTERWDPAVGDIQPGQYVVHRVPAIVDEDTWEAANRILAENREFNNTRNSIHPDVGLLKDLVRCGYCGSKMYRVTVKRRGRVEFTYKCTRREVSHGKSCSARGVQASLERLDREVWEQYLLRRLLNPANVRRYIEVFEQGQDAVVRRAVERRSRLDKQIAEAESMLEQCLHELLRPDNSEGIKARWRLQANEQERVIRELPAEREPLDDAAGYTEGQLRELRGLYALLSRAADCFEQLPPAGRRRWLMLLKVQVRVWRPEAPGGACRWEATSDLERWLKLELLSEVVSDGAPAEERGNAVKN
jgi:site-specific DNA recombinase